MCQIAQRDREKAALQRLPVLDRAATERMLHNLRGWMDCGYVAGF
jgi:hypothetical protein